MVRYGYNTKRKTDFLVSFPSSARKNVMMFQCEEDEKKKEIIEGKRVMRRSKNSKMAEYMYVYVSRSFRVDSHLFKF